MKTIARYGNIDKQTGSCVIWPTTDCLPERSCNGPLSDLGHLGYPPPLWGSNLTAGLKATHQQLVKGHTHWEWSQCFRCT